MVLKTNCLRAFFYAAFSFTILITIFNGVGSVIQGKDINLAALLFNAFPVGVFGGLIAFMFTPHEMIWSNESFSIKATFSGSREFSWECLEAYSSFGKNYGSFLIKFKGKQAFYIAPFGFLPKEWNEFQSMLRNRFPEKKASFWIGSIPIHFGKK